jgi:hypothetical protein
VHIHFRKHGIGNLGQQNVLDIFIIATPRALSGIQCRHYLYPTLLNVMDGRVPHHKLHHFNVPAPDGELQRGTPILRGSAGMTPVGERSVKWIGGLCVANEIEEIGDNGGVAVRDSDMEWR